MSTREQKVLARLEDARRYDAIEQWLRRRAVDIGLDLDMAADLELLRDVTLEMTKNHPDLRKGYL